MQVKLSRYPLPCNNISFHYRHLTRMNVKPAQFWIDHLHLIKHPGPEDGYFAVPFEDCHTVLSRNKVHLSTMSLIVFALCCVGWKECCFHRVFSTNQSTSPGSQHNVLQMSVNRNALPSSRPSLDHLHRQRWCHRHITAQESRVGAWGWQGSRLDLSCSCQHVVYTCRWGGQSRWLLTLQLFSCSWFPHRWLQGEQTRRNSVDI